MCYWVGTKKVRETLFKQWQNNPEDEIAAAFYETFIAPTASNEFQEYGVAVGKGRPRLSVLKKDENRFAFDNIKWSLKWSYTNKKTGQTTERELLNSTCEKVFWQHQDIIYTHRCVVPVDGYYEFFHHNKETYPHFIYPKEDSIIYLGGIYDELVSEETGDLDKTMSIITLPPNEIAKKLHNNPKAFNGSRMLLILDKEQVADYLNPNLKMNEIKKFFVPYSDEKLSYHPVVRFLSKEYRHLVGTQEVQEPTQYPELEDVA